MNFANVIRQWHYRRSAIHELRSLAPEQRQALARDVGVPEETLQRLIERGDISQDKMHRLMYALKLDAEQIALAHPAVLRDITVTCSGCAAIDRCRHELDAGSAQQNYHEFCPNAATFDELREEAGADAIESKSAGGKGRGRQQDFARPQKTRPF